MSEGIVDDTELSDRNPGRLTMATTNGMTKIGVSTNDADSPKMRLTVQRDMREALLQRSEVSSATPEHKVVDLHTRRDKHRSVIARMTVCTSCVSQANKSDIKSVRNDGVVGA